MFTQFVRLFKINNNRINATDSSSSSLLGFFLAWALFATELLALLIVLIQPELWQISIVLMGAGLLFFIGAIAFISNYRIFAAHIFPITILSSTMTLGFAFIGWNPFIAMSMLAMVIIAIITLDMWVSTVYIVICLLVSTTYIVLDLAGIIPIRIYVFTPALIWVVTMYAFLSALAIALTTKSYQIQRITIDKRRTSEIVNKIAQIEQLSISNDFFNNVIKTLGDGLIVADHNGQVTKVNPALTELLGYTERELVGRPIDMIMAQRGNESKLDTLFRLGIIHEGEKVLQKKDGTTFPVLFSGRIMFDTDHHASAIVIAVRDIQELKSTQDMLRKMNERFEQATSAGGVIVLEWQSKNSTLYINRAVEDILGYTAPEIESVVRESTFIPFIYPDDRPLLEPALNSFLQGVAYEYTLEHRLLHKEGHAVWVFSRGKIIPEGENTRWQATLIDIRTQKQSQQAYEESEQRFRNVADSLGEGLILLDTKHTIQYANEMMQKLTLFTEEELVGANLYELLIPENFKEEYRNHERMYSTGIPETYEIVLHRKNGEEFYAMITASPLKDGNGQVQGIVEAIQDISARKEVEHALRESEQLFRHVVDGLGEGLTMTDNDGKLIFANQMMAKLTGYTVDEMLGNYIKDLLIIEEDKEQQSRRKQDRLAGRSESYEIQLKKKDGTRFDAQVISAPRINSEGEIDGIVGAIQDISERKQAQAALRDREQQYRDLFENVTDLIQSVDSEGVYQYVNQAWLNIMAYDEQEIPTLSMQDVIAPEYLDHCLNVLSNTQKSQEPVILETVFCTKTGDYIHVEGNISLHIEEDGSVLTRGIFRDITARKLAEERLENSMKQFRTIYEQAGAGISILDSSGKILSYNQAIKQIFSQDRIEAAENFSDLFLEEDQVIGDKILDVMQSESGEESQRYEARITRSDDRIGWVLTTVSTFPSSEQNSEAFVAIMQDITDQKEIQDALRHARDEAESASRAKSEFLASMSHELRTPLNAIIGFAQILEQEEFMQESSRPGIKIIYESGQHLLTMINDLIEVARLEAGHTHVNNTTFDLPNLLAMVKGKYEQKAIEKDLWLRFERGKDLPQNIQADEGKLSQVLSNLIDNAIKFTENGGVTVSVHLEWLHEQAKLTFAVQDTGVGIKDVDLESIFNAFYRSTPEHRPQLAGSGLGLSITNEFVKLMGGRLNVQSTLGTGTIFEFSIPIQVGAVDEQSGMSHLARVTGLLPQYRGSKILVTDDRLEARKYISALLDQLGFDTREATDGLEAIQFVTDWNPDAVLMDIKMPGMGGMESARIIREEINPTPYIIGISANGIEKSEAQLSKLFDECLQKPISKEELLFNLQKILELEFTIEEYHDLEDDVVAEKPADEDNTEQLDLTVLPYEWRVALSEYALMADITRIKEHLDIISQDHPLLHRKLTKFAEHFEFGRILDLIEPTLGT